MFVFYRLVYDVNRNILWAYFPHGFYGLLCAHWNYVYSRWSKEKINHHFQHSMIHLSILRLTFLFILYVFFGIFIWVFLRLQRYICLVFYVLFKNLLRSNNCKRQKDYKYCWIWVNYYMSYLIKCHLRMVTLYFSCIDFTLIWLNDKILFCWSFIRINTLKK